MWLPALRDSASRQPLWRDTTMRQTTNHLAVGALASRTRSNIGEACLSVVPLSRNMGFGPRASRARFPKDPVFPFERNGAAVTLACSLVSLFRSFTITSGTQRLTAQRWCTKGKGKVNRCMKSLQLSGAC